MDPVKIIIFVGVLLLLLLLGRKFSSTTMDPHAPPPLPPPPPEPHHAISAYAAEEAESPMRPAVVGADIPFPISLPPVARTPDGRYNRPNFLNYYFHKIDLVAGPADKRCFYDQFVVETQDAGEGSLWTYRCTVATPAGLQRVMDEERLDSLYIDSETVIVSSWDLEIILGTVVKEIMKVYQGVPEDQEGAVQPEQRS